MIKGASGEAAEIAFHLASASDPLSPITGHVFAPGEVLVWLPGIGSFVSANTSNIVEKGFGDYALQLTSTDSGTAGTAYLYASVSGGQPFRAYDFITDPLSPAIHELPFVLQPLSDPIFGDGTGHVFTLGEVQVKFSGASYVNVPVLQLVERGHNFYAATLTPVQRGNINLAYLYANVSGMVPFSEALGMAGFSDAILTGSVLEAAEIPFHLADSSDPLTPVTGHVFSLGEVVVWWPSVAAFVAINPSNIVEKGFGDYAVQGTALETSVAGTAYLYSNAAGSLPFRAFAFITDLGDAAIREVPFVLLPISSPVLGDDLSQTFSPGQVKIKFTGTPYVDATIGQLVERGHSMYGIALTPAQRNAVNLVYNYANIPGIVPFSANWDMVITGTAQVRTSIGSFVSAGADTSLIIQDVISGNEVLVTVPTAINTALIAAQNITGNLRGQQLSDLTLPSLYKRAFLVANETDEIALVRQ